MRKQIIAGNWKMNNDVQEAELLIRALKDQMAHETLVCDLIVCPPFVILPTVRDLIAGTKIKLGAQNMHFEENGAFTGEISAKMLKSVGCEFVILGHSERRTIFGETDQLINKKILKALSAGLKPIFCIGETLQEREDGVTFSVIERQIREGLSGVDATGMKNIIVAYEPVWAIGTGKNATPEQAQEVHAFIRNLLTGMYTAEVSGATVIQYGGSMKPDNAKDLLSREDIDGGLIGGACLKAESFLGIAKAAR